MSGSARVADPGFTAQVRALGLRVARQARVVLALVALDAKLVERIALARVGRLRGAPRIPACFVCADADHGDAVDRAHRDAQLAPGACVVDDRVHQLRPTDDAVHRAGLDAQGATDAPGFGIYRLLATPGSFRTDAALKRAYESIPAADLDLYEKFSVHQNFYNQYFSSWRHSDLYVNPYSRQWVTMFGEWKNKGYPTLIDEQKFSQYQQAGVRPQNDPFSFDSDLGWLRDAERMLPGFTYDPKHPERVISTYVEHMNMLRLRAPIIQQENIFDRLKEPDIADLLMPRRAENEQFMRQRETAMDRLRMSLERMQQEKSLRVADGSQGGRELSSFDNLSGSLAVEEKNLQTFMQSWAQKDGLDALRADMLSKRLFVISSPPNLTEIDFSGFNRRR